MLLASLIRQVAPLARNNTATAAAMLSAVSARLPLTAPSARRAVALAPAPAPASPRLLASIFTRAQKDQHPTSEPVGAKAEGGEGSAGGQLQPPPQRSGTELSAAPRGGDLMDLPLMMPVPFRRMADHMMQMQREMDSLMSAFGMPSPLSALAADPFDIFDRAAAPLLATRRGGGMRSPMGRLVPLEVDEDREGYTVTAEVPGFDKNEIKMSLSEDGMLTMTGAHEEDVGEPTQGQATAAADGKEVAGAATGTPQRASRRYASFVRSVQLPDDADRDAINATVANGVLSVRIPKTPKPAPRVRDIPLA